MARVDRLTDSQHLLLWAIALGSKGANAHGGTRRSLLRRGLIAGREFQGEWIWEVTSSGDAVLESDDRSAP
jgi:hypothetical protein